jgi:Xaa-Pro aminopeptidase
MRRLERLSEWMADERLDCTVAVGADHVNHLTGYWRYFGMPSAAVVHKDGRRTLVLIRFEEDPARDLSQADEIVVYGERGFGLDLNPAAGLVDAIVGLPDVAAAGRIGLASELPGVAETVAGRLRGEVVDADGVLGRIRLIKDRDELERIRASYELCWAAQAAVGEKARPGVEEIELFTAAQSTAQIGAGAPIEFVSDLLSGPRAAEVCCPVAVAGRRKAEEGDPVVADIVVRSNGYWGDSCETHLVGTNDEVAAIRGELLSILAAAGRALVPGATGAEVFRQVDDAITAAFPGGEFPHHGGHGLGLGAFEDPHIIPTDSTPFEEGMVLAVEPGVYFPGRFGARVENVFLVTPDGGVDLREALGDGGR